MSLKLTIYETDELRDVKRIEEADKLKIPYRTAIYVIQSLENVDLENEYQIFNYVTCHIEKLDKIIKATFNVTDTELDCIDLMELGSVAVDLYKWAAEKVKGLKRNNSKNAVTAE